MKEFVLSDTFDRNHNTIGGKPKQDFSMCRGDVSGFLPESGENPLGDLMNTSNVLLGFGDKEAPAILDEIRVANTRLDVAVVKDDFRPSPVDD